MVLVGILLSPESGTDRGGEDILPSNSIPLSLCLCVYICLFLHLSPFWYFSLSLFLPLSILLSISLSCTLYLLMSIFISLSSCCCLSLSHALPFSVCLSSTLSFYRCLSVSLSLSLTRILPFSVCLSLTHSLLSLCLSLFIFQSLSLHGDKEWVTWVCDGVSSKAQATPTWEYTSFCHNFSIFEKWMLYLSTNGHFTDCFQNVYYYSFKLLVEQRDSTVHVQLTLFWAVVLTSLRWFFISCSFVRLHVVFGWPTLWVPLNHLPGYGVLRFR